MTHLPEENDTERRTPTLGLPISRRTVLRTSLTGAAIGGMLGPKGVRASGSGIMRHLSALAQATPTAGGTLTVAITGQPDSMDPAKAGVYASYEVYDNIFSKLINVDPDGKFVPDLARTWTAISPTEWEFELVENAVFHNGEPFTAKDVKFTFDRLLDPATASRGATLFASIKSVEPVGDFKVKFTLSEPFGPLLSHLAGVGSGQIFNETAMTSADPARNPVGTGPFKFVEWMSDDHITLERWDQYFKPGKPYLDQLIFRGMPVDDTRMAALEAGEVDWVDAIPLQKVAEVRDGGEYSYYSAATAGFPIFLAFNTTKPPFDNMKLRQAVAWAIDRSVVKQLGYLDTGELADQEVPSGSPWHSDLSVTFPDAPDVEKAKSLLAESGFDVTQQLTIIGLPQYPELLRTAEVIKDNLAQIGLDVAIDQQEVTVWAQNYFGHTYEMTPAYWATVDPDEFYYLSLHSTSTSNPTGYNSPELDRLAEEGRTETDFEKRKAIYTQARELVNQEVPLTFVHYDLVNYVTAKNVMGTQVVPSVELQFEDVWISS